MSKAVEFLKGRRAALLSDGRSAREFLARANAELKNRVAAHTAIVEEMRDIEAALSTLGEDMSVSWLGLIAHDPVPEIQS